MLQIVMEMHKGFDDRDRFMKAIVSECKKKNKEYTIVTKESDFDYELPYVIIEPCTMAGGWGRLNPMLNCDDFATASEIVGLVKNYSNNANVLVIGRGELVGKPVVNILMDETNSQISVVNSHVGLNSLINKIENADIIINGSSSVLRYDGGDIVDKLIIDANDNFKNVFPPMMRYGMRDIGKLTVQRIVKNYIELMKDYDDDEMAATILHDKKEDWF